MAQLTARDLAAVVPRLAAKSAIATCLVACGQDKLGEPLSSAETPTSQNAADGPHASSSMAGRSVVLEGRVVDRDRGFPVAGAELEVLCGDSALTVPPSQSTVLFRSNSAGGFRFEVSGEQPIRLTIRAEGYAPRRIEAWSYQEIETELSPRDFEIARESTLRVVLDEDLASRVDSRRAGAIVVFDAKGRLIGQERVEHGIGAPTVVSGLYAGTVTVAFRAYRDEHDSPNHTTKLHRILSSVQMMLLPGLNEVVLTTSPLREVRFRIAHSDSAITWMIWASSLTAPIAFDSATARSSGEGKLDVEAGLPFVVFALGERDEGSVRVMLRGTEPDEEGSPWILRESGGELGLSEELHLELGLDSVALLPLSGTLLDEQPWLRHGSSPLLLSRGRSSVVRGVPAGESRFVIRGRRGQERWDAEATITVESGVKLDIDGVALRELARVILNE